VHVRSPCIWILKAKLCPEDVTGIARNDLNRFAEARRTGAVAVVINSHSARDGRTKR
jgi:hypothetical protein